ncbi:hypothetical protein BDW22DRAFT_1429292 [Trametopsis cervina]|nr:hypothetical protein BDW22DRAFT_1429292 [Trametopsis cervina]
MNATVTCLSLAPILRCESLSHVDSAVLLIPPALEIVFCVSLCINKRGADRKHLLLAGDGLLYFVLATLDVLAHSLSVFDASLSAFKAIDITIGILSAGPILMFTLFLALLTAQDFLPVFPRMLKRVTKYTLLFCVPVVVLFNALGSFLSLEYSDFVVLPSNRLVHTPGVKYKDGLTNTFVNSLTLVILVFVHATSFSACMIRFFKAILEKKRIESTENGNDNEAVLLNGLGWMAAGIKFGFVDAILGFVGGTFCVVMIRRGLRFLSRACLIIGVIKGVDVVEDFSMFTERQKKLTAARRSGGTILSFSFSSSHRKAFRPSSVLDQESKGEPLSPGYSVQSFSVASPSPLISAATLPSPPEAHPRLASLTPNPSIKANTSHTDMSMYGKRVVVHYRHGRAPTLDLRRFSQLVVPLPRPSLSTKNLDIEQPFSPGRLSTIAESIPNPHSPDSPPAFSRTFSLPPQPNARMRNEDLTRLSMPQLPPSAYPTQSASEDIIPSAVTGTTFRYSTKSFASDSLEVVHALAEQFPGVPSRRFTAIQSMPFATPSGHRGEESLAGSDISRSNSSKSVSSTTSLVRRSSSLRRKPVPPLEESEAANENPTRARPTTYSGQESTVPPLPDVLPAIPIRSRPLSQPGPSGRRSSRSRSAGRSRPTSRTRSLKNAAADYPKMPVPTDLAAHVQAELEAAWKQLGQERQHRPESIKSIGSVAKRRTPSVSTSSQRSSVVPEWHTMPDFHYSASMQSPAASVSTGRS